MTKAIAHNLLTIDLEDYFQNEALDHVVPGHFWLRFERRLDETARRWIALLHKSNTTATFFAGDWVAREHPAIVREIADAGHEIAVLGLFDQAATQNNLRMFNSEIETTRSLLEQLTGIRITGFRLARGAMTSPMLKAAKHAGFHYDSSEHDFDAELPKGLLHVPPAAAHVVGIQMRALWQHAPEAAARWAAGVLTRGGRAQRFDAPFLDPDQPRITALSSLQQGKHYRSMARAASRIEAHVSARSSMSIAEAFGLARDAVTIVSDPASPSVADTPEAVDRPPVTLVVPCYNEAASIDYLANTLAQFETGAAAGYTMHYVLVDDGSTDATYSRLLDVFGTKANTQILRHEQNRGVAAATLTGIRSAPTELAGVIDCDCSYDPAEIIRMIPLMEPGVALVTASPHHPEGRVVHGAGWHPALHRRVAQLYRLTMRSPLHTYTSCVRLYRKSAIGGLTIRHEGFTGLAEIIARIDQKGARITESPVVLDARLLGHSKMKIVRTGLGHIGLFAELMFARLSQQPQKTFGVRT
jgi:Glycosyl transferase family 2/Polysaccharide deacetylase